MAPSGRLEQASSTTSLLDFSSMPMKRYLETSQG